MHIRIFLLLILTSASLVTSAQSGWTRKQQQWFVKLDYSSLNANTYYNPNGDKLTTSRFQQQSINLYAEYGFKPRLTFTVQAPLIRSNSFETTEKVFGPGDLRLEAKYRITGNKWPVSISLAPEIPTGRANAFAANKQFPEDKINLPTGDGEFNLWTTAAASKSFWKMYASVFGAYNYRTRYKGKSFRDLYQFGAELGYNPWKPLWFNVKLRTQHSIGTSKFPELGFVRGDGSTYTLASFEAYYKIYKSWGLTATYLSGGNWIAPFKNIYIAPYFSIGIAYEKF